jgi:hypothetical protein
MARYGLIREGSIKQLPVDEVKPLPAKKGHIFVEWQLTGNCRSK